MTNKPTVIDVLAEAAATFRRYEALHNAKTPADTVKANANAHMARACEQAVARDLVEPRSGDLEAMRDARVRSTVETLAAYALNLAYGAELQEGELENIEQLAKLAKVKVTDTHKRFSATRIVTSEIQRERRSQIERHGFTAAHDDANPERLHEEVLDRVRARANNAESRHALVEAAAIIVAEIERLDRVSPAAPV